MKFVLLHEGKNDEGIRAFFAEVWELYVKVSGHCWLAGAGTEDGGCADDDEPVSYGAPDDWECSV
jgi:hypothetical protein